MQSEYGLNSVNASHTFRIAKKYDKSVKNQLDLVWTCCVISPCVLDLHDLLVRVMSSVHHVCTDYMAYVSGLKGQHDATQHGAQPGNNIPLCLIDHQCNASTLYATK